jgi:hypothetical protein
VFMWLLKSAKKGLPVPAAPLSSAQLRQFAGYSGEAASGRLEYQVSRSGPWRQCRVGASGASQHQIAIVACRQLECPAMLHRSA